MRTRKELIYLNIKDLTEAEIMALSNMGLGYCDNCGEIDISDNLIYIHGEDFSNDLYCVALAESRMCSLDKKCFEKREQIAQCGSCELFFVVETNDKDCPHCGSGNWEFGCVDDPDPACFNCKGREDCLLECYQDCQYNPENEEEDTLPE